MVNKPCCIDLYQGDNVSDNPTPLAGFNRVAQYGIPFVIHKASEGTTERDSRYANRRTAWMAQPLITVIDVDGTALHLPPRWGAYHFFHGQYPTAEAQNFLAAAILTPGDAAFIDWENVGASGYAPPAIAADAFCCGVEDAIGRPCAVYGGNVPREQCAVTGVPSVVLDRFSVRHLWFCSYGGIMAELPEPWREVGAFLWQDDGDRYGPGPHTIPGITTLCDNSTVVASMTVAKLAANWSGSVAGAVVA